MAAGFLPRPGTEYGPCLESCSHRDCAATRADAASLCSRCSGPIDYDVSYYRNRNGGLVHAACEENAILNPDRTINDALGLKPETEPIAACIDFSALPQIPRLLEHLRLMARHREFLRPSSQILHAGDKVYLSRSVVERLAGGAA